MVLSSAKSGPDTAYYFSRERSSHVTTYFRTFVRTKYVVTWLKHSRGSNRPVAGPISASMQPRL